MPRHLPHDVAVRLASDVEAVALPILADSPVLTDADLVALVGKAVGAASRRRSPDGPMFPSLSPTRW